MLICVVVLFLLCWGPRFFMEICIKMQLEGMFLTSVYWTRVALFLLPFIHAIFNPIVYFAMSRNFRQNAVKKLTNCSNCRPLSQAHPHLTAHEVCLVPGGNDAHTITVPRAARDPHTTTVNIQSTLTPSEDKNTWQHSKQVLDDISTLQEDELEEEDILAMKIINRHRANGIKAKNPPIEDL